MIAAAPIVADAVADAFGLQITSMPITAEKIVMALTASRPSWEASPHAG
jgi:CO/xanthine dehydrogenase Mo-binding subunit